MRVAQVWTYRAHRARACVCWVFELGGNATLAPMARANKQCISAVRILRVNSAHAPGKLKRLCTSVSLRPSTKTQIWVQCNLHMPLVVGRTGFHELSPFEQIHHRVQRHGRARHCTEAITQHLHGKGVG